MRQGLPDGFGKHLSEAANSECGQATEHRESDNADRNIENARLTAGRDECPQAAANGSARNANTGSDHNQPAETLPAAKVGGGGEMLPLRRDDCARTGRRIATVADLTETGADRIARDVAKRRDGEKCN